MEKITMFTFGASGSSTIYDSVKGYHFIFILWSSKSCHTFMQINVPEIM